MMSPNAAVINAVVGRPYEIGGQGPEAFDCYGLTRYLQQACAFRDMPAFRAPGDMSRTAIAAMIAQHPERSNWRQVERPADLCIVTMATVETGFHMGTFFDLDGGLVIHTLERQGVVADRVFELRVNGWRAFKYFVPET